ASSATSDLAHELERALGGAEVGKIDADIRIDDANQRDIREIESFRDHLRAEQDVDLAPADTIEDLRVRPFAARRIDVHARDACRRITLGDQPLDLLRPEAALAQHRAAAFRAADARRLSVL